MRGTNAPLIAAQYTVVTLVCIIRRNQREINMTFVQSGQKMSLVELVEMITTVYVGT